MLSVKEFVQRINNNSDIDLEILEMYLRSNLPSNGSERYFWKTSEMESVPFDCPLAALLDYLETSAAPDNRDFYRLDYVPPDIYGYQIPDDLH